MLSGGEVERLLTQANVERMRGNFLTAKRLLEQALQKAPERADIHELLGDVYKAVGDLSTALECYKKARELDPTRRSVEEKFASTLLEINPPAVPEEVPFLPKNPTLAVILSALLPGAGQVYNEQWLKGIAMCVVALLSLGYFLQFYHQIRSATVMPTLSQVQQQLEQASVGEILLLLFAGLLAFCIWTWSILDAYKTALKFQREQQKQQPLPPPLEGGQKE
ncbi:MAG: tetratricopeptide repeat protein [Armatimonadota bacterium]